MSFPWEDDEQREPVPVSWQKVTDDDSSTRLTRKERRELVEHQASNKRTPRRKRVSKARPVAHALSKSRSVLPPNKSDVSPVSETAQRTTPDTVPESVSHTSPDNATAAPKLNVTASKSVKKEESSSRGNKLLFSKRDAVTVALLSGTLGFGMVFALADFTRSSTIYGEMESLIRSTEGEIVEKERDESYCPSDLYAVPLTSAERNRSMVWGETTDDGKGLVCLDSPYFFTVSDDDEETLIPVEENVYESYEVGDEYSFDQDLYDQSSISVRTVLPEEENNTLKYGSLGLAILLGAGAIGINLKSSNNPARREEDDSVGDQTEPTEPANEEDTEES